MITAFNIPGLNNSGPKHWQTTWESQVDWLRRVEMPEWKLADRRVWVKTLEHKILEATEPVYLLSHSLGTATIAHLPEIVWPKIRGAFMVAPPNLAAISVPSIVKDTYVPIPLKRFTFPSIVVSSSTDPYCSIECANEMALAWGSRFVNIGPAGHIGSDLDGWPTGLAMFLEFVNQKGENNKSEGIAPSGRNPST